jgi:hypothetical protein
METNEAENPETAMPSVEVQQLTQIDFHLLGTQLAAALSQQIGGSFEVDLQKYENPNPHVVPNRFTLIFEVEDNSQMERYHLSHPNPFDFGKS